MNSSHTGIDLKLFGGLFFLVGAIDVVIIALFPAYELKLFGTIVTGPSSLLVKLHSPAVHLVIGYGFLWLRPWAWGLAVAYGGFGILSELMNQLVFGFHPVRSAFIGSTLLFLCYLVWRRALFNDAPRHDSARNETSEEVP